MRLPTSWTTVTPLSKTIAMIFFILFPFLGFFAGVRYQQRFDQSDMQSLQSELKYTKDKSDFEIHQRWAEYTGYGFSMLHTGDSHPEIEKGNDSTVVDFIHEGGSAGVHISISKSTNTLQELRNKLIKQNSYYPPGNFQNIIFNGYPALKYTYAWNTNLVVIANGFEYFIENPYDSSGILKRMPSTLRFSKEYFDN